jgi:hypothetical protein
MNTHSDDTVNMPPSLLAEVQQAAHEEHRAADELVCDAVRCYLHQRREQRPAAAAGAVLSRGLGLFGSPEDAALLDEVVTIAYDERRRPGRGL